MRYFGGKQRIAGEIAAIINLLRDGRPYLEPFVGGANIISRVTGGVRIASDVVPELIELYKALQAGWTPPETMTAEEYATIKADPTPTPLRGFTAFGCSFAGKYFGGFATSPTRNYATNASRSLHAKTPGLRGATFIRSSYEALNPVGCLIYCDPPYSGTTGYAGAGRFDSDAFWAVCRWWALQGNIVLVSEYTAPPDVPVIWEKQVITDIRGTSGKIQRVEKLFMLSKEAL